MNLEKVAEKLALAALEIEAIKIQPDKPFTWASGWKSPIYNDNRMFLFHPDYRKIIKKGLEDLIYCNLMSPDIIAGIATAGIPHGAILANYLGLPFIYVRDKPKDHGMKNRIEGIGANDNLKGKNIVLVEDLISTGGSSASAVQAIRDAEGNVQACLSIFNYGFPKALQMFAGEIPFKEDQRLSEKCKTFSLVTYTELLRVGVENNYIKKDQEEFLRSWSADPEKWSDDWKASHMD